MDAPFLPLSVASALKQLCLNVRKLIDYDNNWNSKAALSIEPGITVWRQLFEKDLGANKIRLGVSDGNPGVFSVFIDDAVYLIFNHQQDKQISNDDSNQLRLRLKLIFNLCHEQKQMELVHNFQLANMLLRKFCEETGGGIRLISKQWSGNNGTCLKLVFSMLEGEALYEYSPSYVHLDGIHTELKRYDKNVEMNQRNELATSLTNEFIKHMMEEEEYMLHDTMKQAIVPILHSYFLNGIKGQRSGFLLNANNVDRIGWFLTGTPGIGKSSFVAAFSKTLKFIIQKHLRLDGDCKIVKIPLNMLTPEILTIILSIRGISDSSIERMIEQTLTKNQCVILHLEESPEDFALQEKLLSCVTNMLDKLYSRYPEFKSNVIFLITSNYAACPSVASFASPIVVLPPPAHAQMEWCLRKLKHRVSPIELELGKEQNIFPPFGNDVRPLNSWWLSLSYAVKQFDANALVHLGRGEEERELVLMDGGNKQVSLVSMDGFFYFRKGANVLETILSMGIDGFLTPAVVVLHQTVTDSTKPSISKTLDIAISFLKTTCGHFEFTTIDLFTPEDEVKIAGNTSEIRGGLLKFIDDATNPNSTKRVKQLNGNVVCPCLVVANVNELGCIFLRELLENGDKSRTHRLGVSKTGLIFLVCLSKEANVTPQLKSRAHYIMNVT